MRSWYCGDEPDSQLTALTVAVAVEPETETETDGAAGVLNARTTLASLDDRASDVSWAE